MNSITLELLPEQAEWLAQLSEKLQVSLDEAIECLLILDF